ncbi:flavin reductase family protein [Kitasatospora sp. NBC_01287]|uniref:flavin reductase family protein n=1 Tax=Kitasatospora sp. NBC_01287 TaxID=2903573 RepID=UPI00224D13C0|nr:flavin reductase family protein [Kitasatospora sp. NBC_01287]MCX4751647.1 flavin reductase family protein [Kitasatospora sp. NBC_01287]
MTVDAQSFREALACVAMQVTVVTTRDRGGAAHGTTLGSLCSLSLSPPLVLFCLAHRAGAHDAICGAERFCLSVLAADQQPTAARFAGPAQHRFGAENAEGREEDIVLDGLPAVRGALAWLVCVRHSLLAAGDHTIVVGEVQRAERSAAGPGGPLVYHDRHYRALAEDRARRDRLARAGNGAVVATGQPLFLGQVADPHR